MSLRSDQLGAAGRIPDADGTVTIGGDDSFFILLINLPHRMHPSGGRPV